MSKQTFTTGQILTAAQMTTLQANDYNQTVNAKVASYTLVATDAGTRITMNNASATTITVNTSLFTAGDTLEITNIGAGVCTVTAGTATVSTSSTLALKQYDSGQLYFTSTGVAIFFAVDAADSTSPLTTKGDLYTYSTTDTRLAVGNNGETLVADSSTSTGLRYQSNWAAGKNKIINGDFGIWQRGAGAFTTSGYTADRFTQGGNQPFSTTRQTFGTGDAPTAGYAGTYYARIVLTASASTYYVFSQKIEDVRTFAGQTVTLSYWAKANSNVTNTASYERFTNGATYDSAYATANTITTSWQRFTATFAIPSTTGMTLSGTNYIEFKPILIQDGAARTIDIWGVQVEAANTATAFQTATGTIQGELAACQRYFQSYGSYDFTGDLYSTSAGVMSKDLPVTMRIAPTPTYPAAPFTGALTQFATGAATPTAVLTATANATTFTFYATGAAGLSAAYFCIWTGSTIQLSSEL